MSTSSLTHGATFGMTGSPYLLRLELQPAAQGPQGLAETLIKDQQRWSAVIRDSGFKASN